MENKSIISQDQSKQLVEAFFRVNFNTKKLIQTHKSEHSDDEIVSHVKKVLIGIVFDMERELMMADKIKAMLLAQNKSQRLINALMNIGEILRQEQISDLTLYYRNKVSRVTVYQTDFVTSAKRISIYEAFLRYANNNGLFNYRPPQPVIEQKREMVEDPMLIYSGDILEQLYQYFTNYLGNISLLEIKLVNGKKHNKQKFSGLMLKHNIRNLYLIGLYRAYRAAMRKNLRPCSGWQTFSSRYLTVLDRLEFDMLKILLRVAIYDDASQSEIVNVSKAMRRRLIPKAFRQSRKVKQSNAKKQQFYMVLKDEMKKLLTQGKQNNQK